ncbi:MAG TPA: Spy/CpxP family protein refolding chaperone [Pseudolabrys sp.]|nr:Spy/CpxP family protein refolding chaperone [Pseudolabrys sp.]
MKRRLFVATALLIGNLVAGPALAQPAGPGGPGPGWGRDMMMGPGMMGSGRGMGWMCSPRGAGLAEWRRQRIEQLVKPTESQRKALDDLQAASAKAAEAVAAACPREIPASVPARLELMEKRMDAMLTAIKTVRPAFDVFYATLSEEQKARLNSSAPRGWGWGRWR